MSTQKDITVEVATYRQCLMAVWLDFSHRFDTCQDWDLCDLFADIGCSIFEFYIAQKHGIQNSQKVRQYQLNPTPESVIVLVDYTGKSLDSCECKKVSPAKWNH